MKEKDGFVDCPEQQLILYVEKEDGSYGPLQTGSYLTKHYLDDFFEKRKNLEVTLKEKVTRKEISPIAYYMTLIDLSEAEAASRTGLPRRKIRKHMNPEFFTRIPQDTLEKYSRIFNVAVSDILNLWH